MILKFHLFADVETWGKLLRRIAEGAAMIRTKGEAGSGNIVEAVRHMRTVMTDIKRVTRLDKEEIVAESKRIGAPVSLLQQVAKIGKFFRSKLCSWWNSYTR